MTCYKFQHDHGYPRPARLYKKRPNLVKTAPRAFICSNCSKSVSDLIAGRCETCSAYYRKHGIERPEGLYNRTRKPVDPKWCKVCTAERKPGSEFCQLCETYFKKHGRFRPKHIWDSDPVCTNCSKPIGSRERKRLGGLCETCSAYKYKYKKDRPPRLWGGGKFGFCMCGNSANHRIDDYDFCDICYKEYTAWNKRN